MEDRRIHDQRIKIYHSELRVQRASEGFHYGNPPDHISAVKHVQKFLRANAQGEWLSIPEFVEHFHPKFNKKEKLRSDYSHSYDLAVVTPYDINTPFLYIEVDGEKHSKKAQQINDGLAEKYVTDFLKREIIRLDKDECNGTPADIKQYLKEKLANYLK